MSSPSWHTIWTRPAPPPSRLECADIFLSRGALQHATKLALDAAAASELPAESISPNDGFVTRLLDANLRADRQIGGALLEAGAFALGSFDASLVGGTCEAVGLHTQAMRLHSQPEAIARVLCHPSIGEDAASARVGQMGAADGLVVLTALLRANTPPAQQKALAIARAQWSVLSHTAVVSAYESAQAETGLLMYLSARMAKTTDDPDLTLTYLRVCRRAGRGDEVERITRDRAIAYEPRAVLELLQEPLPPPALGGKRIRLESTRAQSSMCATGLIWRPRWRLFPRAGQPQAPAALRAAHQSSECASGVRRTARSLAPPLSSLLRC